VTTGVLTTRSRAQSGRYNSAASAVDYLLAAKDGSGKKRDPKPVVLEGNARLFVAAAQVCTSGPAYLSLYFSDRSPSPQAPLRPMLRYLLDLQKTHLRAGLEPGRCAFFSALHQKNEGSWDAHFLVSSTDTVTRKKLRLLRPRADFERFTKLRALFNQAFGLPEPCLPTNVQPLRLKKGYDSWQPPQQLERALRSLNKQLKEGLIGNRTELIAMLAGAGEVVPQRNSLLILPEGKQPWTLEGYPASSAFDCLKKLRRNLRNTCRFSSQVFQDSDREKKRIMELYRQAVEENSSRYGPLRPRDPDPGLLVPDLDYFRRNYLRGEENLYAKTKETDGREQPGRTSTAITIGSGDDRPRARIGPADQDDRRSGTLDRPTSGPALVADEPAAARSPRRDRQEAARPPEGNTQLGKRYREQIGRWLELIFSLVLRNRRKKRRTSASPARADQIPGVMP
jgi:hypothetical protein